MMSKNEIEPLYLLEYYNCKPFYHKYSGGINHAVSRMINTLIYAMNKCERLLRFILMIPDADIVKDVIGLESPSEILRSLDKLTIWFVKQAKVLRSRKHLQFIERKPGSVYSGDPKLIFVWMLRRPLPISQASNMSAVSRSRNSIMH